MSDDRRVFNGIDGATGGYLLPPLTTAELARIARGEKRSRTEDEALVAHANRMYEARQSAQGIGTRGLTAGYDPRRLEQTGWAIIFPELKGHATLNGEDAKAHARRYAEIREQLAPLINRRKAQASRIDELRFKELTLYLFEREGRVRAENRYEFFRRQRPPVDGNAAVQPDNFPYYVLLVGGPDEIPYRLQYQLDVQYAVGRVHFDTVEEYGRYAKSVVEAEKSETTRRRRVALWGPRTRGDMATELSADHLLKPLGTWLESKLFTEKGFRRDAGAWTLDADAVGSGTKARLAARLGGAETPALLMTASHGLYYRPEHDWHRSHTGALLCQDWSPHSLPREQDLFAAHDIPGDADLAGLVSFHFACYGAGMPARDGFEMYERGVTSSEGGAATLGRRAFVSRLPQRLLAHPKGGALAVVGHIDRAWGSSFYMHGRREAAPQLSVFQSTLRRLLEGYPVGAAMDYFNERYAATTAEIASVIGQHQEGVEHTLFDDETWMADRWLESNDARNYAVIGDPAVRIGIEAPSTAAGGTRVPQVSGRRPSGASALPSARATATEEHPTEQHPADGELDRLRVRVAETLTPLIERPIEVWTYSADDPAAAGPDDPRTLRAWSRIEAGGETRATLPMSDGALDEAVWQAHLALLERAQAHRAALLATLVGALGGAADPGDGHGDADP